MFNTAWLRFSVIVLLVLFFSNANSYGDCRGCCSHHGGVVCSNGATACSDGSPPSQKCKEKNCNKCGTQTKTTPNQKQYKLIATEVYHRKLYRHWIDEDGDCQNTRQEVLILTSQIEPKFKTKKKCIVVEGKWFDPYSGETVTQATQLDIDHIVPLAHAHGIGARSWSSKEKERFANDFENLIPVSAKFNRKKGAKGPTEWMPPNKRFHCEYVTRWRKIITKYKLSEPSRAIASVDQLQSQACAQH